MKEAICENETERLLTSLSEEKTRTKTSFVEVSLGEPSVQGPIGSCLTEMIEKETIFGANDLSPNFLVIEDSEEELDPQTSFTSDKFPGKNSSAPFATHEEDSFHSKTSSPSLNRP